jgi:hypothetical protein
MLLSLGDPYYNYGYLKTVVEEIDQAVPLAKAITTASSHLKRK